MSKRGTKPALRIVSANEKPAKRRSTSLKVPAWVPAIARDVWRRVTTELKAQGRLTPANRDAIDGYVSAIATIRKCHRSIEREGDFFTVPNGAPKPHPGFSLIADAERQARMMAGRLGLIEETREAMKDAATKVKHVDGDDALGEFDL